MQNQNNFIKKMLSVRVHIDEDGILRIRIPCGKCRGEGFVSTEYWEGVCAPCRGTGWSAKANVSIRTLWWGLAVSGMLAFGLAFLRTSISPAMQTWTPRDIDPGTHLFYMSPVLEAVNANGGIVPAWDGNRVNQVSILECSETQARIADGVWIDRALLLADWCAAGTYERVKP
jgi:hypothetical protein